MLDRIQTKTLRCAIYTRKSSEEGLEQDFNSLHAQREACEAYILSQKHEGWTTLPTAYDDGGYSGGSIERPALRMLLADIDARKVDVVVVYKVDRLTRSLTDFAKIVEVFDSHAVSFVSVTQQFNTTTSMGRLTLNVLLSFAQFEREVTGERIRDKIAASKKKGMWMGGWVAIGYDRKDRTLVINNAEAETVRAIFRLYLELKNVRLVAAELKRLDLRTKPYSTIRGRAIGNRPFSRGHIYNILACPLYVGEIAHKGHRYPALHPPIIDPATWDAVQKQLQVKGHTHSRPPAKEISLLAGLLFDHVGNKLIATHTCKGSKRYRYYVQQLNQWPAEEKQSLVRLPAGDIESLVIGKLSQFLVNRQAVVSALELHESDPSLLSGVLAKASELATILNQGSPLEKRSEILRILRRITIERSSVCVKLSRNFLYARLLHRELPLDAAPGESISLQAPINLVRRGPETKLVIEGSDPSNQQSANALIKTIARGFHWFDELCTGRAHSLREIAAAEDVTERFVAQQMQVAFLAPKIIAGILTGRINLNMTAKDLAQHRAIPVAWSRQSRLVQTKHS